MSSNLGQPERLYLIADDLTGACDAAAPFALRGLATEVLLEPPFLPSLSPVQSFCTATRDVASELAVTSLHTLASTLSEDRDAELFKKIDSVFRGNTMVEIAATLAALPDRLPVIAPALPAQGRVCQDGHLHITDIAGRRSLPLRASFAAAGLSPDWLPCSLDPAALQSAMGTAKAVFCEASGHQHLRAIVTAAKNLARPILWVGSAGLAHALAETTCPVASVPRQPEPRSGKVLILTGSDHPVTHRQLAALTLHSPAVLRIERNQTSFAEIRAFASAHRIAALVLNGGDTALHVCRALSIHSLCLGGEYAPGIPFATACGGPWQGTRVVLKSGGFGEGHLLLQILEDLQS